MKARLIGNRSQNKLPWLREVAMDRAKTYRHDAREEHGIGPAFACISERHDRLRQPLQADDADDQERHARHHVVRMRHAEPIGCAAYGFPTLHSVNSMGRRSWLDCRSIEVTIRAINCLTHDKPTEALLAFNHAWHPRSSRELAGL